MSPKSTRVVLNTGRRTVTEWGGVGVVLCAVMALYLTGIGNASFWYDEAATLGAIDRPAANMHAIFSSIDLVHAAYYYTAHAWGRLFGYTEVGIRSLSAVCAAAAATGTYVLGRRFVGHGAALAAMAVVAMQPRMTWMSGEARSFALTTLIVVALTAVLAFALRSGRTVLPWLAYAVIAFVGVHVYIYVAFAVLAHGVTLVGLRSDRRRLVGWLVAAVTAGIACLAFARAVVAQKAQVSTVPLDGRIGFRLVVEQFFLASTGVAAIVWAALILGLGAVVVLVLRGRSRVTPGQRRAIWLLAPLVVVPTLCILAYSALVSDLYQSRGQAYGVPFLILLVIVLLDAAFGLRAVVVFALVAVVASVPSYAATRTATAKGTDWRQVAEYLGSHAGPATGVLYAPGTRAAANSDRLSVPYEELLTGLDDVTLTAHARYTGGLFDARRTIESDGVHQTLMHLDRLYVVEYRGMTNPVTDTQIHEQVVGAGLVLVSTKGFPDSDVQVFGRG